LTFVLINLEPGQKSFSQHIIPATLTRLAIMLHSQRGTKGSSNLTAEIGHSC